MKKERERKFCNHSSLCVLIGEILIVIAFIDILFLEAYANDDKQKEQKQLKEIINESNEMLKKINTQSLTNTGNNCTPTTTSAITNSKLPCEIIENVYNELTRKKQSFANTKPLFSKNKEDHDLYDEIRKLFTNRKEMVSNMDELNKIVAAKLASGADKEKALITALQESENKYLKLETDREILKQSSVMDRIRLYLIYSSFESLSIGKNISDPNIKNDTFYKNIFIRMYVKSKGKVFKRENLTVKPKDFPLTGLVGFLDDNNVNNLNHLGCWSASLLETPKEEMKDIKNIIKMVENYMELPPDLKPFVKVRTNYFDEFMEDLSSEEGLNGIQQIFARDKIITGALNKKDLENINATYKEIFDEKLLFFKNVQRESGEKEKNETTKAIKFKRFNGTEMTYNIHYNSTDKSFKDKERVLQDALKKLDTQGVVIPDGFNFYILKHAVSPSGKKIYRAEFFPPNSIAFTKNIFDYVEGSVATSIRNDLKEKERKKTQKNAWPTLVHELGHALHYSNDSLKYAYLNSADTTPRLDIQAKKVSAYASRDGKPKEFVAEVFTGLIFEKDYDDNVLLAYKALGGYISPSMKKKYKVLSP